MKQVVNGKVYDTETAELIHEFENPAVRGDFHYLEESLYRTANGAYFLAGSGGAMTGYRTPLEDGSWGGGSTIQPLSEPAAIEWLENHGGTEAILEHFAASVEQA